MSTQNAIKVIVADDHELFRDGLKVMLKKQPIVRVLGEAANGKELVRLVRELQPDVVLTDIKMPVMDGIEAAKVLTREFPDLGLIALSMFDEENLIVDMLEAGAKGYLLKNAHKEEILEAIKTVNEQEEYYCAATSAKLARLIAKSNFDPAKRVKKAEFTERELEIVRLICQELSNKEIAERLHLSVRTVEGYRDKIQDKMNVRNAAGIVIYAIRNGIYNIHDVRK